MEFQKTISRPIIFTKRRLNDVDYCGLDGFKKPKSMMQKEISQPIISTKRLLNDVDDCGLDEIKKPKTLVQKYPPPTGVQFIRDFPPGCGIIHEYVKAERKPLKKLDNVDSNIGYKLVNSEPYESNKLNSFRPKELEFNKSSFCTKPSPKVKFWDPMEQLVHDFPPVCGIIKGKKPLKNLDNINLKLGERGSFENNKLKSFKPKKSSRIKKTSIATRVVGKVKSWDPTCSKDDDVIDVHKSKDNHTLESLRRQKIRVAMTVFHIVYTHLLEENRSKQKGKTTSLWRVPMEVAKIAKQKLNWMNPEKALGQIQGVQPGDMFKFRSQLQMVGLHCQPTCGIDYTKINGKNIAISIVDSHRYSNVSGSCDVLSYCGEGGVGGVMFGFSRSKPQVAPADQKLERANLALKNSMDEKSLVRVIRKVFGVGTKNNNVYVYDGLYTVKDCTQKRSSEGKMVFMFQLHKIPGQPHFQKLINAIPGYATLDHYSTFQMLL